ncbi:hypothetical protein O1L44_11665 [Streptomyces noursei]|nr:hypothetical protein [Streptomyces noursei]
MVAAVGAGDAFAAGFLSAALRGLPLPPGSGTATCGPPPPHRPGRPRRAPVRALADRLAALDDGAWGTLHLGPGWTDAMVAADQEGHAVDERSGTTDERHAPGAGGVERSEARA